MRAPQPTDCLTLQQAADRLGVGRSTLFTWLRQSRVLDPHNLPYRQYEEHGYFRVRLGQWHHPTIGRQEYSRVFVTQPCGLNWLRTFINQREKNHVTPT